MFVPRGVIAVLVSVAVLVLVFMGVATGQSVAPAPEPSTSSPSTEVRPRPAGAMDVRKPMSASEERSNVNAAFDASNAGKVRMDALAALRWARTSGLENKLALIDLAADPAVELPLRHLAVLAIVEPLRKRPIALDLCLETMPRNHDDVDVSLAHQVFAISCFPIDSDFVGRCLRSTNLELRAAAIDFLKVHKENTPASLPSP